MARRKYASFSSPRSTQRSQQGYTLIELLVVMSVLAILALGMLPLAEISLQRDREHELKHALLEIRDAIDAYKRSADAGLVASVPGTPAYPSSLSLLVTGTPSPKGGPNRFFLRRIPRDPFADPNVPADKTWGLRSFYSPPEAPRPGADVYDVYSQSGKIGLNGIPLKDW